MDAVIEEIRYDSFSGGAKIYAQLIKPSDESEVRAVLQIAHGMAEHSSRYLDFAKYFANHGFAVCINDHYGHGKSVEAGKQYGYLGDKGYPGMVEDMRVLKGILKTRFAHKGYFLLGHSMGSFLSRAFISKYPRGLKACVLVGTGAGLPSVVMKGGIALTEFTIRNKGAKAYEERLKKLTVGSYNKRIKNPRTQSDWLSRDADVVDKYEKDPLCGFMFTSSGYNQLLKLLHDINKKAWFTSVPKELPLLLVSGEEDPVGGYSKGVMKVNDRLVKTGHNTKLIIYPGARHEVLNEINKHEVYEDILNFLNSHI